MSEAATQLEFEIKRLINVLNKVWDAIESLSESIESLKDSINQDGISYVEDEQPSDDEELSDGECLSHKSVHGH